MRHGIAGAMLLITGLAVGGCQGGGGLLAPAGPTPYKGSPRALLARIREANAAVTSCYLEYEIKVTEDDVSRTLTGKAWVKGTAVRQEEEVTFEQPRGKAREVRASTGNEAWVYRLDEGMATVNPLSADTRKKLSGDVALWGPLALVVQRPTLGPQFEIREVWNGGRKQYCIDARGWTPSATGPWARQVTWVDAEDLLVRRVQMEGTLPQSGKLVHYERDHRYWNYQPNVEMADDTFTIDLPPGTRVVRGDPI